MKQLLGLLFSLFAWPAAAQMAVGGYATSVPSGTPPPINYVQNGFILGKLQELAGPANAGLLTQDPCAWTHFASIRPGVALDSGAGSLLTVNNVSGIYWDKGWAPTYSGAGEAEPHWQIVQDGTGFKANTFAGARFVAANSGTNATSLQLTAPVNPLWTSGFPAQNGLPYEGTTAPNYKAATYNFVYDVTSGVSFNLNQILAAAPTWSGGILTLTLPAAKSWAVGDVMYVSFNVKYGGAPYYNPGFIFVSGDVHQLIISANTCTAAGVYTVYVDGKKAYNNTIPFGTQPWNVGLAYDGCAAGSSYPWGGTTCTATIGKYGIIFNESGLNNAAPEFADMGFLPYPIVNSSNVIPNADLCNFGWDNAHTICPGVSTACLSDSGWCPKDPATISAAYSGLYGAGAQPALLWKGDATHSVATNQGCTSPGSCNIPAFNWTGAGSPTALISCVLGGGNTGACNAFQAQYALLPPSPLDAFGTGVQPGSAPAYQWRDITTNGGMNITIDATAMTTPGTFTTVTTASANPGNANFVPGMWVEDVATQTMAQVTQWVGTTMTLTAPGLQVTGTGADQLWFSPVGWTSGQRIKANDELIFAYMFTGTFGGAPTCLGQTGPTGGGAATVIGDVNNGSGTNKLYACVIAVRATGSEASSYGAAPAPTTPATGDVGYYAVNYSNNFGPIHPTAVYDPSDGGYYFSKIMMPAGSGPTFSGAWTMMNFRPPQGASATIDGITAATSLTAANASAPGWTNTSGAPQRVLAFFMKQLPDQGGLPRFCPADYAWRVDNYADNSQPSVLVCETTLGVGGATANPISTTNGSISRAQMGWQIGFH